MGQQSAVTLCQEWTQVMHLGVKVAEASFFGTASVCVVLAVSNRTGCQTLHTHKQTGHHSSQGKAGLMLYLERLEGRVSVQQVQ